MNNDNLIELLSKITDSTKSIYELTARIDEKIKGVIERQNLADVRHEMMQARIDQSHSNNNHNWKTFVVDITFKVILVAVACYLVYKY